MVFQIARYLKGTSKLLKAELIFVQEVVNVLLPFLVVLGFINVFLNGLQRREHKSTRLCFRLRLRFIHSH